MSKKDKSKAKRGEDGMSAKAEGETCYLQLPQDAYDRYLEDHPTDDRRNRFWRYIFSLLDPEDTKVYGFEHIDVTSTDNVRVESGADDDAAADDDDRDPVKLCDEGGR